jgi:4-amino-4-deoxychorismate lyase
MSETDTVYVYSPDRSLWVKASEFTVPNRAMNYGDGIFETMVFDGEKIRFFDLHLDRLSKGLEVLRISADEAVFRKLQTWFVEQFPGQCLRIRWTHFRAGLGKYTPQTNDTVQMLQIQKFIQPPLIKARASFAESISLFPYPWSRFKTLNSLPYIMAAQERVDRQLDELILLDHTGKIAEASSSNIFWRKGKKVYTPALECGGIDGIARRAIISKIPRLITEGIFGPNDLLKAEQVWISNVTGISYLEKIDSLEFSTDEWEPISEIFE